MNFDLENELQKLVREDKLDSAIQLVEKELGKYQETDFPKIIGKNLLHQIDELGNYLEQFINELKSRILLKSVYGEMNGFSINYDLWFIDFFGFDVIGEMDNLDWLSDCEDENTSENWFVIKGFEEIQEVYKRHHENKMYEKERHEEAADICDYAVILRLQELFRETIKKGNNENKEWANLPILVTAHDYELIYRMN